MTGISRLLAAFAISWICAVVIAAPTAGSWLWRHKPPWIHDASYFLAAIVLGVLLFSAGVIAINILFDRDSSKAADELLEKATRRRGKDYWTTKTPPPR